MATQTDKPESEIPTAASKWGEETLDLLNAKFDETKVTDFDIRHPFGMDAPLPLPPKVQAST